MRFAGRIALVVALAVAGVGHFVRADEFLAQVPLWMPAAEAVVAVSGVIEIALAVALLTAPERWRGWVGWITAIFFIAIFPGNLWQFIDGRDAFGLDSDAARFVRLLFQPVLVVWALWATAALPGRAARNPRTHSLADDR